MVGSTSRRMFFQGCACCALAFSSGAVNAADTLIDLGCGLDPLESKAGERSSRKAWSENVRKRTRRSSGNKAFDRSLGRVLVLLSEDFGVRPEFYFYEHEDPKFVRASEKPLNDQRSDGLVLFGTEMLANALRIRGGDAAALAVCAHEFAHIAAFKRPNEMKRLIASGSKFVNELHADFLSGYFVGKYSDRFPDIDLAGARSVWIGLGSRDPKRPGSHGTVEMRRKAINAGYDLVKRESNVKFDRAFAAASSYISFVYG